MFESFCKEKLAPLALRLALGSFCVYHGYLKIMAAGGTAWYPALPKGWQLLISWGEFCAGVAIVLGFRCRWAAGIVLALTAGTLIWWQGWNVFRLPLPSMEPTVMFFTLGIEFTHLDILTNYTRLQNLQTILTWPLDRSNATVSPPIEENYQDGQTSLLKLMSHIFFWSSNFMFFQ